MTEEEFRNAIHAIEEYNTMLEAVQNELFRLKSEVKEYMKTHGISEAEIDGRRVRLQEVNSHRFDVTAFRKVHGKLHEEYSVPLNTFKLTIT